MLNHVCVSTDACLSAQTTTSRNNLHDPAYTIPHKKSPVDHPYTPQHGSPLTKSTSPHSYPSTIGTDRDQDVESVTSNSSDISTGALQNIRNRMVTSLRLIGDLEEQVHKVPELQQKVAQLRNDNVYLTGLIKRNEQNGIETLENRQPPEPPRRKGPAPQPPQRRSSFSSSLQRDGSSVSDLQSTSPVFKRVTRSPVTRDIGVGSSGRFVDSSSPSLGPKPVVRSPPIVTREIGVATNQPIQHSRGTNSEIPVFTNEELDAAVRKTIAKQNRARLLRNVNVSTQLDVIAKPTRSAFVQTKPLPKIVTVATMTGPPIHITHTPSSSPLPKKSDNLPCQKCVDREQSDLLSRSLPAPVISLQSLNMPAQPKMTSSIHSSCEAPLVATKSIAVQVTPATARQVNVSTQSNPSPGINFGCQHSPHKPALRHKLTETHDLFTLHHKSTGTDPQPNRIRVIDQATNTNAPPSTAHMSINTEAPHRGRVTNQSTNTNPPAATSHISTSTEATKLRDASSATDNAFSPKTDQSQIQFHCPNGCPNDSVFCESCKQAIRNIAREIGMQSTPLQKSSSSGSISEFSRIPRPTTAMSPRMERKFERQTTYTVPNHKTTAGSVNHRIGTASGVSSDDEFRKTCPAEEILR